jgi:hypothetical protein
VDTNTLAQRTNISSSGLIPAFERLLARFEIASNIAGYWNSGHGVQ